MLDSASKFLLDNAEGLKVAAEKFAKWLKPWVDDVVAFFSKWFKRFMDPDADVPTLLGKMFKEAMDNIKPLLEPVFNWLGTVLKDSIKSLFLIVLDTILSLIPGYETLKNALNRAGEQDMNGAAGGTSEAEAIMNASDNDTPPPKNNSARDWAWSVMSGQSDESKIPASLKDQVSGIMNSDTTLKKQAEDYKASAKQKVEDAKRRQEEENKKTESKKESSEPETAKPVTAAPASQESRGDAVSILNSNLATLNRLMRETADNTKSTAEKVSRIGNLYKSG
jgi:hypothetical protein